MKEIIFSFILILSFSNLGNSQMEVSKLKRKTHLKQLKAGILLVQLPNSDKKINILREQGKEKRAKKEEKEVNNIRESIIKGFEEKWDYSQVLFFEAKNAKEVFLKNPDYLLNADLQPIKEFPNLEHLYSVRYGIGNPNGEVYRYNGVGFQIRYVKDGALQALKYDIFYHWKLGPFRLKAILKSAQKRTFSRIQDQITEFNYKLQHVIFPNY
ncbi:MAG: hypothetical protein AB8H03_10745 [Saprospiraceae bacterium]